MWGAANFPCIRFQGLVTLLAFSSSQTLRTIFQVPAFLGFSLQSFSPRKDPYLFRGRCSLAFCLKTTIFRPFAFKLRFRAFFPLRSHSRHTYCYVTAGAAPLLGLCVSEAFSRSTLSTTSGVRLFCTFHRIDKNSVRYSIALSC